MQWRKSSNFLHFWRLPSVKSVYFTLMKIRLLNRARQTFKTEFPAANPLRGASDWEVS